jgi:glycosyltransferase involved in cell wall biosynthesis
MPEITVVMAVYNGMPYLNQAIDSILEQTFSDFEFLIVNDCSNDGTRDAIAGYDDPRIRVLDNEENIKQTRSLNRGLQHTRSEFVARMDADDVSDPQRLEKQLAFLKHNSEYAVVGSSLRLIDPEGMVLGHRAQPQSDVAIRWMQFFTCPLSNGAAMFRNSVIWDEMGGYDPTINLSQDWDLWIRVPASYKLANLPDFLLDIRQHPKQETTISETVAHRENREINRMNPRHILGSDTVIEDWEAKMDLVLFWEHQKRRDNPGEFLELIETLFARFCERFPSAESDPDVLKQLAYEYAVAVRSSGFRHLPVAAKALRRAWPLIPKTSWSVELLRWLLANAGARRLKKIWVNEGRRDQ